jgi:hypothetical protein
MSFSKSRLMTIPEIAVIAATRGIIGLGAGLLLAGKFTKERRKIVGWSLFLSGLVSTIPIAMRVFGKTTEIKTQSGTS